MQDALFNGRKFRSLTIVDNISRYCHAIRVGKSIKGIDVVEVMEALKRSGNTLPKRIHVDNRSEFISKEFDRWAYDNKVVLDYSRPGKPTDNPFIESFNGSFKDECLNVTWFLSLDDVYEKISAWTEEYNNFRPHSSLNDLTPQQVVAKHLENEQETLSLPVVTSEEKTFFA